MAFLNHTRWQSVLMHSDCICYSTNSQGLILSELNHIRWQTHTNMCANHQTLLKLKDAGTKVLLTTYWLSNYNSAPAKQSLSCVFEKGSGVRTVSRTLWPRWNVMGSRLIISHPNSCPEAKVRTIENWCNTCDSPLKLQTSVCEQSLSCE